MVYDIGHVRTQDIERGNPLPLLYGLLFPISSKGRVHSTVFVTPVVGIDPVTY